MSTPMREQAREIALGALRDLRSSWWSLLLADVAYKVIAFALLSPAVALLLRWQMSRVDASVVADADIARFLLTTRVGFVALVGVSALVLAISALEVACLMTIGLAAAQGKHLTARSALTFAGARAPHVLRLTVNITLRVLAGVVPFLLAAGLVYMALLREHDINYYLAERPPAFWAAVALVAPLAVGLLAAVAYATARWALALPLLLFENIGPRRVLGESAKRAVRSRSLVAIVLSSWAVVGLGLLNGIPALVEFIGRSLAPQFAGSLALLLAFVTGLVLLWGALGLAVTVLNISMFSLLLVRLYLRIGDPQESRVSWKKGTDARPGSSPRFSRPVAATMVVATLLAAGGFAMLAFLQTRINRPVLVIAHRGASAEAPENTLAAFRLAVEEGADFVELDVQESSDGEVFVVHDSDLMKLGGPETKIWEADSPTLRLVDIGSYKDPRFSGERVPTLAEALAVCKGRSRVVVELKSYGHDVRLVERVAAVVEAAGMENECIFMSLDHEMVRKMKRLRPHWRCGVLAAKAIGNLTSLDADFVAVEARMATPRFVRRSHRAGQDVYVWTVNDPAWMLTVMSRGVDGLITDRPGLAREVVKRRAALSDSQRLLVALLVRTGARTESLAAEDALRP